MDEYGSGPAQDQMDAETGDAAAPTPSLPRRLFDAFVSPAKMGSAVAANPKWLGAMLVCAGLLALSVALLPYELFEEMQRRMTIQSGRPVQEMPENARNIIRIVSIAGAGIGFVIFSFIGAAVTTFVFAFVLGDEGKYRQYLAVGVHAAVIPTVAALLLIPMRIAAGDPQLTINLSTFLVFLPDGFVSNVFRALDVSRIWSSLVAAQGIHAIDRRRSFGSAAAIQLGILLVIAFIAGWILTRQGL
jgi:hypothetical protein